MRHTIRGILLASVLAIFVMVDVCMAQPVGIEQDKQCPVCGMYPARYPRFNCEIIFRDGSYEAFDSATELLIYLLFPEKIGIRSRPIKEIYFKDYLKSKWLEAEKTLFVVRSKIMGPMGVEFIGVDSSQAAKQLKESEESKDVIAYKDITRQYMIEAAKKKWLHYLATSIVLK